MPDPITHSANAIYGGKAIYGGTFGAIIAATFGVPLSVVFCALLGAILAVSIMHKFSLSIGFLIIVSGTAGAAFATPWLHSVMPLINENGIAFFTAAGGITFWGNVKNAVAAKLKSAGEK